MDDAYAAQFESGDALAEADIYIAYGRYPQAVDLLKTAIGIEPQNTAYRVKLMEVCVEMNERAEFQQQYADLQVIGDDTSLQRARDLLGAIDGGESWLENLPPPLLEGAPSAAPAAVSEVKEAVEIPASADEAIDLELEGDLADADSDDEQIDVDLELDAVVEDMGSAGETGLFEMEDLALGGDDQPIAPGGEADAGDLPDLELDEFDASDSDELTLDTGEELLTEFGELEIEDPAAEPAAATQDEELVFAADGDEVATKLDLARAYMDMGDEEGARTILDEVIEAGSDTQKQEAQALLETIS